MEPLEIYDSINNKVIRVYVSAEVGEKCRSDTEFAQDLFNKLRDQDIEEGCAVEVETIKTEATEEDEPMEGEDAEIPAEEKNDKEIWTRHETLKLIMMYGKYKDTFKYHKQKRVVWSMIAAELCQHNVFRSASKCAEKWKNLVRTYKIADEKPNVPTKFRYYQEMKKLFNNSEVSMSDSEMDEKDVKHRPMSPDAAELKDSLLDEVPEKESWSRYETLKFLKAFQMLKHMKQSFSKEKHFWAIVTAQLAKDNIHKHHEKCSAKWKNLLRSYRKNLEKPNTPSRFQYFQEVNDVLNDTELEIPDHLMRLTDVEKIVDPEQFKTILEESELESSRDPISWAADETLKLIEAYKKHKNKFSKSPSRKYVWSVISSELAKQGIYRDSEKIENKWKSLLRSYRRGERKGKGENPRFYFYDLMCEALNDEKVSTTQNDEDGKESTAGEDSIDDTDIVGENSDHAYTESAGYEQIIIQTEPEASEDNENHWSYSETSALLSAYTNCKNKFKQEKKSKLWEEVSKELRLVGVKKSAEICEKKWKKMFSVFKIHKLNKTGPGRFQFYQEMDDILKDELGNEETDETVAPSKRCKCSEKRLLEKQNRHIERMQMLKRKLDLEERKVEAFEFYVKQLKETSSN